MSRLLRFCFSVLMLGVLLGAAPPGASLTVLSGWIRVATEDAQGGIVSVELVVGEGAEEEPYLIREAGPGAQLKGLVGEWVVVSGLVVEDPPGWKSIEVQKFTRLDDLPEPVPVPGETPKP